MQTPKTPIRALLVEDDADDYTLIRDMLSAIPDHSFELQWVKDFDATLRAVSDASHDICLLDYRLGEGTGLELLEAVRQKGCTVPVIFLTGQGDRAVELLAMKAGADDYVEKEKLDSSLLERSIRYAIDRRQKEDALQKAHNELEQRVRERTAELAAVNEALQVEIAERKRAQEALERNELHFRNIMDNTIAMMGILDRDGVLVEANRTALDAAGLSLEDVLGKRFEECYWWAWSLDVQERLREAITRAARGESSRYNEIIRVGEERYITIDFMLSPIYDHEGQVAFLVPSASDITERIKAEEALQDLEWMFVPKEILPMVEDINQIKLAEELMKLQRDLALGLGAAESFPGAMLVLLEGLLELDGIDTGGVYAVEKETGDLHLIAHKGFSPGFVEKISYYSSDSPQANLVRTGAPSYWYSSGEVAGLGELIEREGLKSLAVIPVQSEGRIVATVNLSSRTASEIPPATRSVLEVLAVQTGNLIAKIEAEEAMRKSEEKYRGIFENAPFAIIQGTIEGKPVTCNPFAAKLLGYETPEDVLAAVSDVKELYVNPEERLELIEALLESGAVHNFETRFRRRDGESIFVSLTLRAIREDTGHIKASEGLFEDITARKRSEEAVRLHLSVMETVAEGIFFIGGDDYRIKWTNTRLEEMFGYDPGEMIGMHVDKINAPTGKTPAETRIFIVDQLLQAKEWHGEIQNIKKDGTTFWCHAHVSLFDHPQFGRVFVAAHTEIDKRKQLEEELRQANDGLEARVQERTLELCKAFQALTAEIRNRKTAEDALRKSEIKYRSIVDAFDGYIILYSPDYRIRFMSQKFISSLGYDATGKLCYEVLHSRDSICPWCINERVFRGETVRFEMRYGRTDRYYYVVATPVKCSDGSIWKQAILIDITDRKLAEINLKARETELAEKSVELEETNTALRILLKRREEDKTELEENIMYNAQQMLTPYIEKMKNTHLDNRQKLFMDILESNVNEIISPFARNLFWKFSNLTAMELQVAALVQQGKRIKEIADILKITEDTVKFHRLNLRKKCGLKERKSNLKAFLQSLKKV